MYCRCECGVVSVVCVCVCVCTSMSSITMSQCSRNGPRPTRFFDADVQSEKKNLAGEGKTRGGFARVAVKRWPGIRLALNQTPPPRKQLITLDVKGDRFNTITLVCLLASSRLRAH